MLQLLQGIPIVRVHREKSIGKTFGRLPEPCISFINCLLTCLRSCPFLVRRNNVNPGKK